MPTLTVLSPHRDDAVFSLGLSLGIWSKKQVRLRIVNFFTQSAYAPRTALREIADISRTRATEDRRALRLIDPHIEVLTLNLLDAPIRLGIASPDVFSPEAQAIRPESEIRDLAARIRSICLSGNIMAPLGLGNHVDHLTVRDAAIALRIGRRLGFYEDLPYAMWTSPEALTSRVLEIQQSIGTTLRPAILRAINAASHKRPPAQKYGSQIGREEATAIAKFSVRYSGGERIWIPNHTASWCAF